MGYDHPRNPCSGNHIDSEDVLDILNWDIVVVLRICVRFSNIVDWLMQVIVKVICSGDR